MSHLQMPRSFLLQPTFLWISFSISFMAWLALAIWPETFGIVRAFQVVLSLVVSVTGLMLGWRKIWIRYSFAFGGLVCLLIVLWPNRPASASSLSSRYVVELNRYNGTKYIWGGETRLGIDCSGLVRRAFIHALWKEGVQTFNPGLIRRSAKLWWYDTSALALLEGYRNETTRLFPAKSILEHGSDGLLPGDLAVTSTGGHVMAFLGNDQWIEADPSFMKVVTLTVGKDNNGWLKLPVHFVRWR